MTNTSAEITVTPLPVDLPPMEAQLVEELPEVFMPIAGGWGKMGMTHIRLAAASEDVLAGALRTAWTLRVEKNARKKTSGRAKTHIAKRSLKKR